MGAATGDRSPALVLTRPPPGVLVLGRLVVYQLRLLLRSPLGTFVTLVVPLLLLVALDLVTPDMTLQSLHGLRIGQFLTPAMASFAVLNVGFVDPVVGLALARDEGILRRLHSSPLPAWAYFAARLITAVLVALVAVGMVLGVGALFFHARMSPGMAGSFCASAAAGLAMSYALGLAAASLVPSAQAALPLAYALLLPVAFISGVFFPASHQAAWLYHLSNALPARPFAEGLEAAYGASLHRLGAGGLLVMSLWTAGAVMVTVARFDWDAGRSRSRRGRVRRRPRT